MHAACYIAQAQNYHSTITSGSANKVSRIQFMIKHVKSSGSSNLTRGLLKSVQSFLCKVMSEERGCSWTSVSLASAFFQVSILAIAFNIYRTVEVSLLMEELLSDPHVYPDFYFLAFWQVLYNNMIAVNIFFAWIKVLILIPFFFLYSRIIVFLSIT